MLNWYAMYCKPQCEHLVKQTLMAEGIETFLPEYAVPRRHGRLPMRPLFPCYLFARVDLNMVGISSLNWMPGMRHVVAFGGIPAPIDEKLISTIRNRLSEGSAIDAQGEILKSGDRVKITSGPFRDLDAVFDKRLSAAGRVRVLLQLLKRLTPVELDVDLLRKTSLVSGRSSRNNVGRTTLSQAP